MKQNKLFSKDFLSIMREIKKAGKNRIPTDPLPEKKPLKIALLGAGSLQYIEAILGYALELEGISNRIYVGTYNGMELDIIDEQSAYNLFQPQITVIFTSYREIKEYPELFASKEDVLNRARQEIGRYRQLWEMIHQRNGSEILQTNFVLPPERQLGNLEANYIWSRQSYVELLNLILMQEKKSYVSILDFEYLAALEGKKKWFDYSNFYLNKCNMSYDCLPAAVEEVVLNILGFCGRVKKCLVLDLDNTLWGGILEEAGIQQINLFPTDPLGEAFLAFQQYIKNLKERGIILAVCSKNDEEYARQVFLQNKNMVLKLEDISCFIANWENKADNIRKIAATLNIGLDSMVFVDDNPVERDIVRTMLPEVEVLELSEDPANYIMDMENSRYFEWLQITEEDKGRSASYRAREEIQEKLNTSMNLEDYLGSLSMEGVMKSVDSESLERSVQLLNKTNQFNTIGYRSTEGEILKLQEQGHQILCCSLKDRFADYGLISVAILKNRGYDCIIKAWVMSCRVFKRGLEDFMLNHFVELARKGGASRLIVEYLPSDRNGMLRELFEARGFTHMESDEADSLKAGAEHYGIALTEGLCFSNKIHRR